MGDEMEAGSSEGETFVNDLGTNHVDIAQEDMEVDDLTAGFANLFCETVSAKDEELNKNKPVTDMEFLCGFSDDFFTEPEEPVNHLNITAKAADNKTDNSNVKNDSDTDLENLGFGLFDDTDDDDDVAYLFDNVKPLPGSKSSTYGKYERSKDTETKPKVVEQDKMFPQNTSIKDVNKGIMGLSLSKSDNSLTSGSKAEYTGPKPEDDNFCSICRDAHTNPKTLKKCSHSFCTDCIDEYFKIKPTCPECFVAYGVITGNQPVGYMDDIISKIKLPGYEQYNTIIVSYSFSDGTQTSEHPHPGQQYHGTSRTAYLPNSPEGQKVLKLLKAAFKRRLTFTVGRSRTTGCDNVVTWNDVHHKTCTHGGQQNFGYPDPTYLQRVQEELAALGVTEESVNEYP